MEELNHKIRIKDIARLAGVSEGTVDRVIHQRSDVSVKSREAVTKVLEEMNYTPNIFARSLASKKQYRFISLFPAYQSGDYWETVDKGLNLAAKDFVHHNVHIEKRFYNQFDVHSFVSVSKEILDSKPDAIFIAPIFREETITFTNELRKRQISFSFIDSIVEDVDFLTYYGQNSFKSGYIAAKLLLSSLPKGSEILVIRTHRNGSVSNQTLSRYNGFMKYIKNNDLEKELEVINIEFNNEDEVANAKLLEQAFQQYGSIKAAITFNSRVYRLASYLATLNHSDIRLIGYDLLEQNISYLKQDVISYLIAQRPDRQAYLTVRDMCRELIFKQGIKKVNYVPIDILMKENIEDYIHFRE